MMGKAMRQTGQNGVALRWLWLGRRCFGNGSYRLVLIVRRFADFLHAEERPLSLQGMIFMYKIWG